MDILKIINALRESESELRHTESKIRFNAKKTIEILNKLEKENAELRDLLRQMIDQFESDHNCEYEYKTIKASKQLLNK